MRKSHIITEIFKNSRSEILIVPKNWLKKRCQMHNQKWRKDNTWLGYPRKGSGCSGLGSVGVVMPMTYSKSDASAFLQSSLTGSIKTAAGFTLTLLISSRIKTCWLWGARITIAWSLRSSWAILQNESEKNSLKRQMIFRPLDIQSQISFLIILQRRRFI